MFRIVVIAICLVVDLTFLLFLSDRPGFNSDAVEYVREVTTADPQRAGALVAELGTMTDAVFARGLAKDPEVRFDSARTLVDELAEALEGVRLSSRLRASSRSPIPARSANSPATISAMRVLLAASIVLLVVGCKIRHGEGGGCDDDADCRGALSCVEGRCGVDPAMHQRMAQQSGVAVSGEQPARLSTAGAVRVRSASAKEVAFALCGNDERLVGGWCDPLTDGSGDSTATTRHGIAGHTKTDTIGAQWKCSLFGERVTAFALCQKVPASAPRPDPP